jgi:hypothetical protein
LISILQTRSVGAYKAEAVIDRLARTFSWFQLHPGPSTFASVPCGVSPVKRPIPVFSAPISPPAFGEWKGVRNLGVRIGDWLTAEQRRPNIDGEISA